MKAASTADAVSPASVYPHVAVVLLVLEKDNAPDGQVQTHPDGVGCHDHLGCALAEPARLGPAHGMGERAVHHAAGAACLAQLGRRGMDVALREDDARIARAHVLRKAHGCRCGDQRVQALVTVHAVRVAKALATSVQDAPHDVEALGGTAYMQFVGVKPDERAAPGAPAVEVAHHLRLVDHGHVP